MKSFPSLRLALAGLLVVATNLLVAAEAPDNVKSTRVHVGDEAPGFEVTTLDGAKFSLAEQRGKVVLVNFFATWCGPCLQELPVVEKEVWQKYRGSKFALIALGREHTNDEVKPFQKKHGFTFPIAGDVKRGVYSRYAEAYIPRSVLIDPRGKVIAHVVGYNKAEFDQLLALLAAELAKIK